MRRHFIFLYLYFCLGIMYCLNLGVRIKVKSAVLNSTPCKKIGLDPPLSCRFLFVWMGRCETQTKRRWGNQKLHLHSLCRNFHFDQGIVYMFCNSCIRETTNTIRNRSSCFWFNWGNTWFLWSYCFILASFQKVEMLNKARRILWTLLLNHLSCL